MADQSLEISNFTGGMTDNFIGAAPNKFQVGVNLVIRPDGKLYSRFGSDVIDVTNNRVPFISVARRVDSICLFEGVKLYQSLNRIHYVTTSWAEVVGPTGNPVFTSSVQEFDQNSWCEWNQHLITTNDRRQKPQFLFKDGTTIRARTLGLPALTNAEVTAITMSPTSVASRFYRFVRKETYTINGIQYEQRSAVSIDKPYVGPLPNSIAVLPVLSNGSTNNYNTTNVQIEIYRTANAGFNFFKVGEVTNGTTTFVDNVLDPALVLNEVLYTDTGDLDYDEPPKAKFVMQWNGIVFYLNVETSEGVIPQRLIQGNPDQPYAAPEGNYIDLDSEITGGGVSGEYPVVFTRTKAYRLQGFFQSDGTGQLQAVDISRTIGCVSHKSIIPTLKGLFFAAKDGFAYTNGYEVSRISYDIPRTYSKITETVAQAKRIYGAYDPKFERIYWAATSDSDVTENDMIFVAHTEQGVNQNIPFTTWDGGYWRSNFAPTSILMDGDVLIRGDSRAYILKHEDTLFDDRKINTAISTASWLKLPIIFDYRSPAFDFGNLTQRKWIPKIALYADSVSRVAFQIWSNNDNTGVFSELAEIRSQAPVLWRDFGVVWRDSSIRWNYLPIISALRRFPARGLRCSYKQIKITNSFTETDSTEFSGTVTVDNALKTVTLNNLAYTWDANAVDYSISFSDDNFTRQYRILIRTATTLTVEDTDGTLPNRPDASFLIKGYRKSEAIRVLSYSIIYSLTSPTQTPFKAS